MRYDGIKDILSMLDVDNVKSDLIKFKILGLSDSSNHMPILAMTLPKSHKHNNL